MNAEEYQAQQAVITASIVALVLRLLQPFRAPPLGDSTWKILLDLLFPPVYESRLQSAELGRRFYDSQRSEHVGTRNDVFLAEYEPGWFYEAMEPSRESVTQSGADQDDLSALALRVAKEVENGGRRTIIRAVEDSGDQEVLGWARIATGRETCAFCLMLVSRGPVYMSASTAGLHSTDTSAAELFARGDDRSLDSLMSRWHPGCDCKVVPVYNRSNWPGRDAYLRAEQVWRTTTEGYSGKDALNALRRSLDSGTVSPRDFAVAA